MEIELIFKSNFKKEQKRFLHLVSSSFFLREFIASSNVRLYIACQFALESAFGTSDLAVIHGNICGMRVPHRRFSTRSGSTNGFCCYSDWLDCIKDYMLWIFFNRPYQNVFDSVDNFKLFLRESGYCPEKDYLSKIDNLYNQIINSKN